MICGSTATPQRLPAGMDVPRWDGSPLEGRTILLYAEQGLGDGWQAARYVPMVARRGGEIDDRLHRVASGADEQVGRRGRHLRERQAGASARSFFADDEFASALWHHAGRFRRYPILQADPQRVDAWRDRLAAYPGLKVGLVWNGKEDPDPLRSITLAELAPLAALQGVQYFSLQVGAAAAEVKKAAAWMNMVDLSEEVMDFGETAACMMNLDLFLCIDTAAAHLAGAGPADVDDGALLPRLGGCWIARIRPGIPRCDCSARTRSQGLVPMWWRRSRRGLQESAANHKNPGEAGVTEDIVPPAP